MSKVELETPVQYLNSVGPKVSEKLKRLGIETVRDLIFYYPRTWLDFSRPLPIKGLRIGDDAIIRAKISQIKQSRTHRKWMSIIEAELIDDSGSIKAIWFNQPFLIKILKPGDEWIFSGKINWDFKNSTKTLAVSQYEKEPIILPVYSETEGITSKYLRKLIKPLMAQLDDLILDYLPDEVINTEKLSSLNSALENIHFPKNTKEIDNARKRLGFDELFLVILRMLEIKKELIKNKSIPLKFTTKLLQTFVKDLPFQLTDAQRKAAWEIIKDLEKNIPMNRLLEGDVGSGKTVVAAMAVLVAAKNNYQSVWLAPTEILANQHFENVSKILKPHKIKVGLLTAANDKANLKKDDLIIGTHALLQKDVHLENLALIIVDEQHRFGVKQRGYLRRSENEIIPHLLSMTATPIPRTLALSLYGDLDLSIINEMPKDRQKIITKIVTPDNRQKAYDFIASEINKGRQAFVICPLIESKNNLNPPAGGNLFEADRKSVIQEYEKLSKTVFPNLKIGLLHGRLKSKEKDGVMRKFYEGKLDILVSTAVVEVGIDIANATVMMVESADRFGLAQLHQFRGRVGRGSHQSYCFLLSDSNSENSQKRLEAMTTCHDGFRLAEIDLEIRGPGELVGIRQAGIPDLKMASLSDIMLIGKARTEAEKISKQGLVKYPKLKEKLDEYESERHLE